MTLYLDDLLKKLSDLTSEAKMLYIPISGGSDSALVYWLFNQIHPQKTVGIHCYVPSRRTPLRAQKWFESNGAIHQVACNINWSEREEGFWAKMLALSLGKAEENYTLKLPAGWLVGCRNKTEHMLGTYSLASRVATVLPIVGLYKTEVLDLCSRAARIPKEIIDSSRKADPDCGRPKEMAEVPIEKIDAWLGYDSSFSGRVFVCTHCRDSRQMELNGQMVMCTQCPRPCKKCRSGGIGPYCEKVWCRCECHQDSKQIPFDPQIGYLESIAKQNSFKSSLPKGLWTL